MNTAVLTKLKKELLLLQGLKPQPRERAQVLPRCINHAFPGQRFPAGTIQEFACPSAEDMAATTGFLSGLLRNLLGAKGTCVWISHQRRVFPPALKAFGLHPSRLLFIDVPKEKDLLWVMEEVLACPGLGAVVGEIPSINFTSSRRLQLVVEKTTVTGFLLRPTLRALGTTASVARWHIRSLPSYSDSPLPGVGFPHWEVTLEKIRNGYPGRWQLAWKNNSFMVVPPANTTELATVKTA